MELPALDPVSTIMLVTAIAAVGSYGVTFTLKQLLAGWTLAKPDRKKPWFQSALLRACSCAVGAALGYFVMRSPAGLGIGFSAGAVNTFLVMKVKERIERKTREDQ
jgi:MFS family permease